MIKYITLSILLLFGTGTSFNQEKPKILIIGDSISIGYTPIVQEYFSDQASVYHNPGNAEHTGTGLQKIEEWLGDEEWDIIQFNWGLWDLAYRHPESKEYGNRDKVNGKITFSIEEYESNLDSLVTIIQEKTDAKLIFVTTTYVPKKEAGRFEKDAGKYNKVAKSIMKKHGILINDLYPSSKKIHSKLGLGEADVHYTPEGYKELGKIVYEFIKDELADL
ncbi:SGNH/GDSL hydrolase family protein [Algoriphagus aestuarii]|nr:SGNH/GDSL hydrolase family protein [Algoriphagus aestuarii]